MLTGKKKKFYELVQSDNKSQSQFSEKMLRQNQCASALLWTDAAHLNMK